jgi:uncharacterized membrane protein
MLIENLLARFSSPGAEWHNLNIAIAFITSVVEQVELVVVVVVVIIAVQYGTSAAGPYGLPRC